MNLVVGQGQALYHRVQHPSGIHIWSVTQSVALVPNRYAVIHVERVMGLRLFRKLMRDQI